MNTIKKHIEKNNEIEFLKYFALIFMFFSLVFARSFVGIYVFGYRVGELFMLMSLTIFIYLTLFKKNKAKTVSFLRKLNCIILISFLLNLIISDASFLNPYSYKTSTYIWGLGFLFLGIYTKKIKVNNTTLLLTIFILIYTYYSSIFGYPSLFENFFLNFSDKYEPHKAADIVLLLFLFSVYLGDYLKNSYVGFCLNLVTYSIFLPLLLYKSRAAFIGCLVFFFYILYENKSNLKKDYLKNLFLLIFCFFVATVSTITSQRLVIQEYTVEEISESYSKLSQYKFNHYREEQKLIYIEDNRIYSADGNLNWRLQMWQDQIIYTIDDGNIFTGVGYKDMLKVFVVETPHESCDLDDKGTCGNNRRGIDGLNENLHNYFLTIFARGGLIHLFCFLTLYFYLIIKVQRNEKIKFYFILFGIIFISSFDSSMENAHFPLIFYFFIGNYFFNNSLKFEKV